jgi:drug/metabolite transporter (DMT)-like permease
MQAPFKHRLRSVLRRHKQDMETVAGHPMTLVAPADLNRPLAAASVMLVAMLIIGFIDNYVAAIAAEIGLWQFQVMRTLLMFPMLLAMSWAGLGTLRPRSILRVGGRSAFAGIAMMCYFGALGFMPIAQALAGLFTSPIFILLITWGLMGHSIGPWRIAAVLMGFLGILLVLQPDTNAFSIWTLLPVAGGLFYAVSIIATRSWCEGESTMALLLGVMLFQCLFSGAMALGLIVLDMPETGFLTRRWVWPLVDVWPLLWLQAVGSLAGVWCIIKAYQIGEAGFVSVFEYSVMIFGPFFAWWLFAQPVGPWQAIGIGLIASAGLIIALRSGAEQRREIIPG